jgi:hypothetical protein
MPQDSVVLGFAARPDVHCRLQFASEVNWCIHLIASHLSVENRLPSDGEITASSHRQRPLPQVGRPLLCQGERVPPSDEPPETLSYHQNSTALAISPVGKGTRSSNQSGNVWIFKQFLAFVCSLLFRRDRALKAPQQNLSLRSQVCARLGPRLTDVFLLMRRQMP